MCKKCNNCIFEGSEFCRYQQKQPCGHYEPTDAKRETNIIAAILAVIAFMLVLSLTGCKQIQTVVEYRDRVVTDTLIRNDSVYINQVHYITEKGDTVYKLDSVYVYKYQIIHDVHDSIVTDSIPYPVEVRVPEKYVPGYYHFTAWAFWICLALLLLFVGWRIFVRFYLHK